MDENAVAPGTTKEALVLFVEVYPDGREVWVLYDSAA
jgi:hypothetical protein